MVNEKSTKLGEASFNPLSKEREIPARMGGRGGGGGGGEGASRKTKIGQRACRSKEENEKNSRGARQLLSRRPYRMLIKRVSTVSKYLTAGPA